MVIAHLGGPDVEVPEVCVSEPDCTLSLRKKIFPEGDSPRWGCQEEHELWKPSLSACHTGCEAPVILCDRLANQSVDL